MPARMRWDAAVAAIRDMLEQKGFDSVWASLSSEEVIAYAQRGHGELRRLAWQRR